MIPILAGTRILTTTKGKGDFYCPSCQLRQHYQLKQVRTFFHLYWLPIFPVSAPTRYAECGQCHGHFPEDAITYDPAKEKAESRIRFYDDVWRFLLSVAAADGEPVPAEVDYIRKHLQGFDDAADSLNHFEEAVLAKQLPQSLTVDETVARFATGLTAAGKEYAVIQGIQLAATDGTVNSQEWSYLMAKAQAMGMTEAHFKGVLVVMTTPNEGEVEGENSYRVQ